MHIPARTLVLLSLSSLLFGCGSGNRSLVQTAVNGTAKLTGFVRGGQQPLSNSTVQLYAAGLTGSGSAATPLLATPVATNASGGFDLTGLYQCPAGNAEVYLVATGGNPGLPAGTNNTAITLVAALGDCAQLAQTSFVNVDEVTTVAAIAALAPFMSSATSVGSSQEDFPSLVSRFTLAAEFASAATGTAPGMSTPAGFVVPVAKIDTLADIVAPCITSVAGSSGTSTVCGHLFALTTLPGGTPPATVVEALLNLAASPALNTSLLFSQIEPPAPFQPVLSSVPSDFAIGLMPLGTSVGALQLSPAAGLSFGTVTLGSSSASQVATLTNSTSSAITLTSIAVTGINGTAFSLNSTCLASLPANTSCSIFLVFTPAAGGANAAFLTVSASASNSPLQIALAGAGTGTAPPPGSTPTSQVTSYGAYVLSGTSWVPLTTTNTAEAIPYVPTETNLYCLNTALAQWVPCPGIAASSSSSASSIANTTSVLKGTGTGSAVAASPQDIANAITIPGLNSQFLSSSNPANPGIDNLVVGVGAGSNMFTGSGADAGTGGQYNVVLGFNAGANMTTSRESVVIGAQAGYSLTGNGSGPDDMIEVLIGSLAGAQLTNKGGASVMIGQKAGINDQSSSGDVLIGIHAGTALTSSSSSVALGTGALNGGAPATAEYSTLIGANAGIYGSGDFLRSTSVGAFSLSQQAGGADNTAIGAYALDALTTGSGNTAVGSGVGRSGITGSDNLLLGQYSGHKLTSGSSNIIAGSTNAAQVSTGSGNVILGGQSAGGLETGNYNVVIGFAAGQNMSSTTGQVLIGTGAGLSSKVNNNVDIGFRAGLSDTTGARSTMIGYAAGIGVQSGSDNTALGDSALSLLNGAESEDIGIGSNAQVAPGVSNAIQIGGGTNATSGSFQVLNQTVLDANGRIHSSVQTPASSTANCLTGAIWSDASYVYVCTAANTVKRAALESFGGSGTPSAVAGPYAASGATTTISGTDDSGVLSVTVGTGVMAPGTLISVTFTAPMSSAPTGCLITPANASAAQAQTQFYTNAPTTTGWSISPVPGATFQSGEILSWNYLCH